MRPLSTIRRQIDAPDGYEDRFVCFVEATERYTAGSDPFTEFCTGETYQAYIWRKPSMEQLVCGCGHEHRSIDAAAVCGARLMRRELPRLQLQQRN
jgi:hypothetical protein